MTLLSNAGTERDGALFDNTRRLARLFRRRKYYWRFALSALGRIPVQSMLRSHFAFQCPDSPAPAFCTIEFTNFCNLKCTYCTSPLGLRRQGMMSEPIFERLVKQLQDLRVPRARIVGNGESTLHPRFPSMVRALGAAVPFVQMVSNGQRYSDETIDAILDAPVRVMEISVDGSTEAEYRETRVGGSLQTLIDNLRRLKTRRAELRSPTLINIRVMIVPQRRERERELLAYWGAIGDCAMSQYIVNIKPRRDDGSFVHRQAAGEYPKCTMTLKSLNVFWNGNVPVCGMSSVQTGTPEGELLGNIRETTLRELWQHPTLLRYRNAHRNEINADRQMCKGCVAG